MAFKNYVDPLLTNIAKGYEPQGHINELILPPLAVNKPTAKIADFGGAGMRIVSTIKSPEGATPVITVDFSIGTAYSLEEHALKAMASDKAAENQDKPFDEQANKTRIVTDLLSMAREYGLASFMNTDTNFTQKSTLSGTAQWGGAADDPIGDIMTAVNAVAKSVGKKRNQVSIVISGDVFWKLAFLDEIKVTLGHRYDGFKVLKEQELAAALGVRQVIVADGRYLSSRDGQTDTYADLWGKHVWAVYIPESPQMREHCFGYTPHRRGGIVVDKWYDYDVKGWWCRATDEYDQYIMDETAAYMIKNAIA